jgi:hypothetical protein
VAKRTITGFTEEEANAFADGIEYVNDSAIEHVRLRQSPENKQEWDVLFDDEDAEEDEEFTIHEVRYGYK